ncbi:hypothetical protein NO1_1163 [Candidatus Termititenax aidoneus]|uniref:Uncharacterized protein n=1 Tax=Termititenax aidoneus TaxID=2218524 RepID=A0A388TAW9_TERA1|nr:hypothetical protein NO1_1163 [Candidatus Termititenax aidoneus]
MKKFLILLSLFSVLLAMGEIPETPKDGKIHYDESTKQMRFAVTDDGHAEPQAFSTEETGLKLLSGSLIARKLNESKNEVSGNFGVRNVSLKFQRVSPNLELDNIDFIIRFYDETGEVLGNINHRIQPVNFNDNFLILTVSGVTYKLDKLPHNFRVGIRNYALKGTAAAENHDHDATWSLNPFAFFTGGLDFMAIDMLTLSKENAARWQDFDTEKTGLSLVGARVKNSNSEANGYYVEIDLEREDPQLELAKIEYLVTLYDKIGNACGQVTINDSRPVFNDNNISTPTSGGMVGIFNKPYNLSVRIQKYTTADGREVSF